MEDGRAEAVAGRMEGRFFLALYCLWSLSAFPRHGAFFGRLQTRDFSTVCYFHGSQPAITPYLAYFCVWVGLGEGNGIAASCFAGHSMDVQPTLIFKAINSTTSDIALATTHLSSATLGCM